MKQTMRVREKKRGCAIWRDQRAADALKKSGCTKKIKGMRVHEKKNACAFGAPHVPQVRKKKMGVRE